MESIGKKVTTVGSAEFFLSKSKGPNESPSYELKFNLYFIGELLNFMQ
jgi:hypothetical protein